MKKGKSLIFLGLLLIVAALSLVVYNLYDERRAADAVDQAMQELPAKMQDIISGEDATEVPDYLLNPNMDMPVKTVHGVDIVGILNIPGLELELPVISRWSYSNLKSAPCRYAGSVYLNNLILCGHNYRSHFGSLKNLQEGDIVIFTDMDGNEFVYEITLLETLSSSDVEGMENGDWDLTLFTCTIGGSYRITVRCELIPE